MKQIFSLMFCAFALFAGDGRAQAPKIDNAKLFSRDNLVAWCIIPFDSKKRNSEERAVMLKELGISKFAYDWRGNDLPVMERELSTMKKHGIAVSSVWFWVNGREGKIIDEENEIILSTLEKSKTKTELWVCFPNSFFEGLDDKGKIEKAVNTLSYIHRRASALGCTVALYNHEDWFGEPENQVKIIEATGLKSIGIVYNFHHGHEQTDDFDNILKITRPYLTTVSLNGMKREGPKIMTIGEGNLELELLKKLKASGYSGTLGIIGHTEGEDVKVVLTRNIEGLKKLLTEMGETEALLSYQ